MRRALSAVAVLAAMATLMGACKKQPDGQATLPPVTVTTSATPTPHGDPTSPPAGPKCIGAVTGGQEPSLAMLKAWLCGENVALMSAVPKDIDQKWSFIFCEGAAGSTYCTYRNSLGSQLIFKSQNAAPVKVTNVQLDRTIFNTDPKLYTQHFVEAWITGNVQRMQALATPVVVSFAASHTPPTRPYTTTLDPAEVYIFKVTSSGNDYRFVLQGQLGKANAITELHSL